MRGRRQRGTALLIALVVVALAALLAVAGMERLVLDTHRGSAIQHNEQALQYALGMEHLVAGLLRDMLTDGNTAVPEDGAWTPPFEVPGGYVQGRVFDQSARFNLNALSHPEQGRRERARQQFQRLLVLLERDPALAAELAQWVQGMDADGASRSRTPADGWYLRQNPPYRRARQSLAHVSELRWLRGMDAETYALLQPLVTALPVPDQRININRTAPAVLAALAPGMDLERARRVLQDGPFASVDAFREHPEVSVLETAAYLDQLTTGSEWYLAQARVMLDDVPRDYYRLLRAGAAAQDHRYFSIGSP